MLWYIAAGILFLIAVGILVAEFIADRRFMRKKTSEAMGRQLWSEIQEEREASKERKDRFQSAMKKARRKEQHDS